METPHIIEAPIDVMNVYFFCFGFAARAKGKGRKRLHTLFVVGRTAPLCWPETELVPLVLCWFSDCFYFIMFLSSPHSMAELNLRFLFLRFFFSSILLLSSLDGCNNGTNHKNVLISFLLLLKTFWFEIFTVSGCSQEQDEEGGRKKSNKQKYKKVTERV